MANIINPNMDNINASMAQVEEDLKALVPGMGVIAKRSGDTQYTADSDIFSYRKTPSSAGGAVNIESIVGASVGYNQLVENGDFSNGTTGWTAARVTTAVANNTATVTVSEVTDPYFEHLFTMQADHVFIPIMTLAVKSGNTGSYHFRVFYNGTSSSYRGAIASTSYVKYATVLKQSTTATTNRLRIAAGNPAVGDQYYVRSAQVIDLTAMLGTTIADYIYSLEQATAGAGVAYFEKYFGTGYHAYNAGSIVSVNTSGRRATGKNLVETTLTGASMGANGAIVASPDFSMHIAKVLAGQTYTTTSNELFVGGFFTSKPVMGSVTYNGTRNADTPKTFTAPIDGYVAFRTARGYATPQIEFGSTATTYEPYKGITYPTTASDLRGIFKLTDGKLTADGDVYLPSGQVTRKYGIVDLGTLNWTYDASYTRFIATISNKKIPPAVRTEPLVCPKYVAITDYRPIEEVPSGSIYSASSSQDIFIKDTNYTDAATFKTAMSGVYLVYELATPTTETLAPYSAVQNAFADGTEEWLDTRSVAMPVPDSAQYASNEQDKLNSLMGAAGADGTYIVAQESGQMRLESLALSEVVINRIKTPARVDVFRCYRTGNVAQILFNNVSYGESFSTDTVIASVNIAPLVMTRFFIMDQDKNVISGFVQTNGTILINGYTAGKLLYGQITFLINQ